MVDLRITARRSQAYVSVTANATVEQPVIGRPWRFLLVSVIEHGGRASTEELCLHLVGSPRHPFIERLVSLAARARHLVRIDGGWELGEAAKEALAEGSGRTTTEGQFEFRVAKLDDSVVDVLPASGSFASDHQALRSGEAVVPASVRRAVHAVRGRRLDSGWVVRQVEDPLHLGPESETTVGGSPVNVSEVDLSTLLESALPEGFTWDRSQEMAESTLEIGIEHGALNPETGLEAEVEHFKLRSGESISQVRVTHIPWRPTNIDDPNLSELAKRIFALDQVPSGGEWKRLTRGLPDQSQSRKLAADFAGDNGMEQQARWLWASWDWDL